MTRYLMTHSLLSSWLYTMKGNPYEDATTERDTYEEFLTVLRREPTPTTEAMQKGIDFEDLVTAIVNGAQMPSGADDWIDAASKVANIVRGGPLQYKASKTIEAGGLLILLNGRLDAMKAGTIYDIKFSSRYERGKFVDSTQHPAYFELVPEARDFEYLISDGREVWTEHYIREETPSILPTIENFLEWLRASGLMALYQEKWLAR